MRLALPTLLLLAGCPTPRADTAPDTGTADTMTASDTSPPAEDTSCVASTWYGDADGDGYGNEDLAISSCEAPSGYVADAGDCGDADPETHPDASEVCDDGVDNDCDGSSNGCLPSGGSLAKADAVYTGEAYGDLAGGTVRFAGDVNADGYDDLVLGAHGHDDPYDDAEAAYLVTGSAAPETTGLSSTVKYAGEGEDDTTGARVAGAGDIDGDGYGDLLIGVSGSDLGATDAGAIRPVLGSGSPASMSVSSAELAFWGDAADDGAVSVAAAGDVDADGYDDFLVGAPSYGDGNGAAYLLLGGEDLQSAGLGEAAAATLTGDEAGDGVAQAVSSAGDLNADGYDDVAIGSGAENGDENPDAAYVFLGGSGSVEGTHPLSDADLSLIGGESAYAHRRRTTWIGGLLPRGRRR